MASLPYGLILLAAVLCSAFGGRLAFASGSVVLAGWVLFIAAWWEHSPAAMINMAGIDASHMDVWAVTDLLAGWTILVLAAPRWWAFALWGMLTAQMMLHCAHQYAGLDYAPYATGLDTLFVGQVAVLFMTGRGRIADLLSVCLHRGWHVLRAAWPASRAEAR